MKYQEYFQQADFEKVWSILKNVYNEKDDSKLQYKEVFDAIGAMILDKSLSHEKIRLIVNGYKEVRIIGAPDPQEWLVGREVEVDIFEESTSITLSIDAITGHLLYWSTLYGIKTQGMQRADFQRWMDNMMHGPYYTLPDNDIERIEESYIVKYIFLDFDGVLNTNQYQAQLAIEGKPTKDEYGALFDPKVVERLAEIIEKTKAEIVITSSWQNIHSAEVLDEMWKKRGLPGELRVYRKQESEHVSHAQVVKSFMDHTSNTPYVILDDEDQYPDEFLNNLIKINPVTGIKGNDVSTAIELLNVYDDMPSDAFVDHEYEAERDRVGSINAESCERKKLLYWRDTILCDEPYDWSSNLVILRKKIEYNIGYYRFTQRFLGWENVVAQMVLCCRLISIVLECSSDENSPYINVRNYSRFHTDPTSLDKENLDSYEYWKHGLRKAKAYKLIWNLLSNDMKDWWD